MLFKKNGEDGRKANVADELMKLSERVAELEKQELEHQKTEERLREFSRAVEQSPATVMITDVEGNIEYVNPKFTELTGYTSEEATGKTPRILKSGKQSDEFYVELWETITSGNEWRGEFHNKKKNGELYWEYASISPIRDRTGRTTHFLAVKEDVTERKMAEERLSWLASFPNLDPNPIIEVDGDGAITYLNMASRVQLPGITKEGRDYPIVKAVLSLRPAFEKSQNSYIMIEEDVLGRSYELHCSYISDTRTIRAYIIDITRRKEMEKLKNDFISAVSHELRTPLSIIEGSIALLLDGLAGDINEKQTHLLSNAKNGIHRLMRIINDLLDISKIEAGKVVLTREIFNIGALVKQIVSFFDLKAKERDLGLKADVPKEVSIYADPDKINQVFTNLIGNALKFTDKGNIFVMVEDRGGELKCSVADTGSGIPAADLPKVFSKFQQFGRTPDAGEKGTGLGLSIAKGIVEIHGGKIWVESREGHGTKFFFTLPKYTPEQLLKERLVSSIEEAARVGESVSLIRVFLDVDSSLPAKKLPKIKKDLRELVRLNLRRAGDTSFFGEKLIAVVLGECDVEGATEVERRFNSAIKNYLTEKKLLDKVTVTLKHATYPDDGTDTDTILGTHT